MPSPGHHWYHITFGTYGSWIPGDPRGFRSKHEKIHSSGDHRNPPPPGEHAKLHQHIKQIKPDPICIPQPLLSIVGNTIVNDAAKRNYPLLTLSVSPMHVHMLIELPISETATEVGKIKRQASMAITKQLPGRMWAKGCGIKPIRDKAHQVNTFNYILKHRTHGAWVWSFKER